VALGAIVLRCRLATGAVFAATGAAAAATGAAAVAVAGAAAAGVAGADTEANVAASGVGAGAAAAFVRSADESAARLGLETAASMPMASAIANQVREILRVIVVKSLSFGPGHPRHAQDFGAFPFCRLSPAKHRRLAM
jgi:hypothetical protein